MATDNFTSNNDPLPSPWATVSPFNGIKSSGGVALVTTPSSDNVMRYSTSSVASSQVKIDTVGGGDGGPAVHLTSGADGYFAVNYDATNLFIYRLDSSSFTNIASASPNAYATNDQVRLRTSGTSVIASINGVDKTTATDNTHRSGNPGMLLYDGSIRVDDWTDGASSGLTVNATTQALTLTTFPATVSRGRTVNATTQALALTTFPATVSLGRTVNATTQALALTTFPATVSRGRTVNATTQALTLTTFPATVVGGGLLVSAATQALTLTTFPATVSLGRTVNAGVAGLLLETFAATLTLGEPAQPARGGGMRMVRVPVYDRRVESVRAAVLEQLEQIERADTQTAKQVKRIKRQVEKIKVDSSVDAYVDSVIDELSLALTEALAIVFANVQKRRRH